MKSIRLSLIVYFLLLLTGALGAVSWFSYRTTEESLRERQRDAQKMIAAQYEARADAAKTELDRQLLRQARALAGMPLITVHYEAVFSATALTVAAMSDGLLSVPLWLPDTRLWPPAKDGVAPKDPVYVPHWMFFVKNRDKSYPKHTHVQSSEQLVADADAMHPQEYFQTYAGKDGQPMQRSESMGEGWFTLDKEHRKQKLGIERYDTVELKPGLSVRRVTLQTPVAGFGRVMFGPWRGGPQGGGTFGPGPPNPKNGKTPQTTQLVDKTTPTFYIQYAADLGPLDESIQKYGTERDDQIAILNQTISQDLEQLRGQMLWIVFATLGAVWLGGYGVIRLGLSPLARMSEAVSQVSPTNFHLPIDPETLPHELRPIAERLEVVLDHLQKAFTREKQAAADISHELRTPLAALMTTLEVGLKKQRSPEDYREILDECRASGLHMYQLVERLLTLARLDAGADQYRPTETDVTEIALNCADLIRPLARARGIALRLHLADPISTETDPNKLREVLVNLLHNAVEYNKPNGAIDLTVERVHGHVRLEVRDTGIGIKPGEADHLFERFYRADPSRHADTPHAGLGLAIVKSYVDLMAGTIQVESSEAGTAFLVEIPYLAPVHELASSVQLEPILVQR